VRLTRLAFILAASATVCGCSTISTGGDTWRKSFDEGFAFSQTKNYEQAEQAYRSALKQVDSDNSANIRRAKTLDALAQVYVAQGNSVEAQSILNRAAAEYEKLWKPRNNGEDNRDYALGLASDYLALANLSRDAMNFDQAESMYKKAYQVEESALGADDLRRSIIENRANLYKMTGRNVEATKMFANAVTLTPTNATSRQESSDTWKSLQAKAEDAFRGGNYAVAYELYQAAFKKAEAKTKKSEMAETLRSMAVMDEMQGHGSHAIQTLQRALTIANEGDDSEVRAEVLLTLSRVYCRANDYGKAEPLAREACTVSINDSNGHHRVYLEALEASAIVLAKEDKIAEAEKAISAKLTFEKKGWGSESEKLAEDYVLLADIQAQGKNNTQAQSSYEKAIEVMEKQPDMLPRRMLIALDAYAKFLRATKQNSLADSIEMKAKNLRSEYE